MTRRQNLFLLAHLCHVKPAEIDAMRVGDFAAILAGLTHHKAERSCGCLPNK